MDQRGKNGKREMGRFSSGGVCEQYRARLEQRIVQGDLDLVRGDEELLQKVEGMLKEGDPRDVLTAPGLDALATMQDALQAPPVWGGSVGRLTEPATAPGLGAISKAFEVLERAALNLYLCPWRKEYRVVKIFSGMFTHLVKPALSEQLAAQLFGLLGYQLRGAELELRGMPPSAAALLDLACVFFAARCETRLLSAAAAVLGGRPDVELKLVQERQKGRSLQEALGNLWGKTQAVGWDYGEGLDLYTAKGDMDSAETEMEMEVVGGRKEKLSAPPVSRESESPLPAGSSSGSVSVPSQSLRITLSSSQSQPQPSTIRSLGPDGKQAVSQTPEDGGFGRALGQKLTCTCEQNSSIFYYCQQCKEMHTIYCDVQNSCRKNKHNLTSIDLGRSEETKQNPQLLGETALPGRTEGGASAALSQEPKVGGNSATAGGRSKIGKASATALDGSKEGGALGAQFDKRRVGQGVTCDKLDCKNFSWAYCSSCGSRICEKCWTYSTATCACGEIYLNTFPMSSV